MAMNSISTFCRENWGRIIRGVLLSALFLLLAFSVGMVVDSLASLDLRTILVAFGPALLVLGILVVVLLSLRQPVPTAIIIRTDRQAIRLRTIALALLFFFPLASLMVAAMVYLIPFAGGMNTLKILAIAVALLGCCIAMFSKRGPFYALLVFVCLWPLIFTEQWWWEVTGAGGKIPLITKESNLFYNLLNISFLYLLPLSLALLLAFLGRRKHLVSTPVDLAIAAFVLWTMLSVVTSMNIILSFNRFIYWVLAPLLFFLVVVNCIVGKQDALVALQFVFLSATVVVLLAMKSLWAYNFTPVLFDLPSVYIFENPNHLGVLLIQLIPMGVTLMRLFWKHTWKRCLVGSAVVLLLVALYMTSSKDTMLWLGLATMIIILGKWSLALGVISISGIYLVYLFTPESWRNLVEWIISDTNIMYRWVAYGPAFRAIIDHPLFGVGLGMRKGIGLQQSVFIGKYYGGILEMGPHNLFVELGLETGLLGPLLLIILSAIVFYQGRAIFRKTEDRQVKTLAQGAMWGLLALFLHSLTEGFTFAWGRVPLTGFICWLNVAMLVSILRAPLAQGNFLERSKEASYLTND